MNNYFVLLLSAVILLWLIFNIKNSRRFNLFDHWLHHQLVKRHDGYSWQVIAFINDPKLMVVWDVLLAGLLLNEERNLTALWVLGTLGFADISGIILKKLIRRQRPRTWCDNHGVNCFATICQGFRYRLRHCGRCTMGHGDLLSFEFEGTLPL